MLDPITAIFHALSQPVSVGDDLQYELFTGEALYRIKLHIEDEELLDIAGATLPTWRVTPQLWKIGTGVDKRLRDATIWVSQAPVRTVLRIRSDVFIGAVYCDLQHLPAAAPPSG